MKTAIYIEDGKFQVVLTPEDLFEKNIIASFGEREMRIQARPGQFYDCQGGWTRHGNSDQQSLIVTFFAS